MYEQPSQKRRGRPRQKRFCCPNCGREAILLDAEYQDWRDETENGQQGNGPYCPYCRHITEHVRSQP
jgi:hypothetical protein